MSGQPNQILVKSAVWGVVNQNKQSQAKNIKEHLQDILAKGQLSVTFDEKTFGGLDLGVSKGFGVVANINGMDYYYAGAEGNTVNFSSILVKFAVWGGTSNGQTKAKNIQEELQDILVSGQSVVTFDDQTFGDPDVGIQKGFSVVANINGVDYYYAGEEGNTVDFSKTPINGEGLRALKISDLNATYAPGVNQIFNPCSLTLTNEGDTQFPGNQQQSSWVSIDFYLTPDNSPGQPASSFNKIGDIGWQVNLVHNQSTQVSASGFPNGIYDLARILLGNPGLLKNGNYYLYAQVRNNEGDIDTAVGAFSQKPYPYNLD